MASCKVYAHLELQGRPSFCLPVQVTRPEDTQFGTVKQALIQSYAEKFPEQSPPEYNECCFWNQDCCPIADRTSVAVFTWEHNDFFLRPLPEGAESKGSALAASREKRGELSYYYAHNRTKPALVSGPQPFASNTATVPARQPIKTAERVASTGKFNAKQSPFGTDITAYETITSYTWEDHDGDTVKVLVPLEGVGKLPTGNVQSHFGVRAFELLITSYSGKNLRFACYKTHGEMKPEECKCVVRANRVNLILRKAKDKDIWFDLFKKRAIGDDDDP